MTLYRDLALELLQRLPNAQERISLLCVRFSGDDNAIENLYQRAGLRPPDRHVAVAEEAVARSDTRAAVLAYALARRWREAADLALDALKDLLSKPSWCITHARELLDPVCCSPSSFLSSYHRLDELRSVSALLGLYDASWKGYLPILPSLAALAHKYPLGQVAPLLLAGAAAQAGAVGMVDSVIQSIAVPSELAPQMMEYHKQAVALSSRISPFGMFHSCTPPLSLILSRTSAVIGCLWRCITISVRECSSCFSYDQCSSSRACFDA